MARFQLVTFVILLACVVGLTWPSAPVLAQAPVFVFNGSSSTAVLEADVFADDWLISGSDADNQTTAGFFSPFPFSGGIVDWGNTLNIDAEDGEVKTSANPLVRLDGDGTGRLSIAWKAFNILHCNGTEAYDGAAESEVTSQINLTLDNLVGDQDYTVYYQWSVEGLADGEHEIPLAQEDPENAEGFLDLDIGGFGPGSVFNAVVDNVQDAVPEWVFSGASEALTFHTPGGVTAVTLVIDVYALARSEFAEPEASDLVLTIMRGTLTLTVDEPLPGVLISEVVDGDLAGGNPKYVEITNCGSMDWVFGTDDVLNLYFNGSATAGTVVSLDGIALAVGESFVIATSRNDGIAQYQAAYLGADADLYVNQDFGNGDDVYSLELGTVVHDTYGWIGVDGSGQAWEYTNSYAFSKPYRAPNGGVFDPDNWVFGGPDALAAATDPERLALLRARTSPGRHLCTGITGVACDPDNDGDVDLDDFAVFAECMFGPGATPSPTPPPTALECLYTFDAEPDSDVDLADFAAFQEAFTGP